MAVAVRSYTGNVENTTSGTPTTTITVTKPTGTADGDLLVAITGGDPDTLSANLTAPSGWTLQGTSPTGGAGTAGYTKFWTHTAASEPSTWTFGADVNSDCHCTVLAITGANNSSPIDGTPAWTSNTGTLNTSHTFPSITTVQSASLRVGATNAIFGNPATTTTWTAPSGWTTDAPSPDASSYTHLGVFHHLLTASGSTGTAVATSQRTTLSPGEMLLSFAIAPNTGLQLSGSITAAGTLTKKTSKIFAGSITPAGTLAKVRVVVKVFTAAITPVGTFAKLTNKKLSGSVTPVGTFAKLMTKKLSGSITPAATMIRRVVKHLSGVITPVGTESLMDVGRVFGKPGIVVLSVVKAGWVRARVRRD